MKFGNQLKDIVEERFYCQFTATELNQWLVYIGANPNQHHLTVKLTLFDDDLILRNTGDIPPVAIDLIEIAAAVYTVDRAIRPNNSSHCSVYVRLPVRCPEVLSQRDIRIKLRDILHWYTGYEWHFEFVTRDVPTRTSEAPQLFNWNDPSKPLDVGLWSGGLDCLAGLYNRAYENPDRQFVLCGTGASKNVKRLQRHIADLLPMEIASRVKLSQVTYELETIDGQLPDRFRMRSRGFTFMVIGAVCAYLEGSLTLQVYENGIGAINLRFRESELGLSHARSVHPFSLMMIAEWLTQVLKEPITLNNPYLFQTKAQMCEVFTRYGGLDIAFATETCDRKHRHAETKQCGRCSSCILRRHAFAALGILDQTPYVYADANWLYEPVDFMDISLGNHIPSVLYQVKNLYAHLNSPDPWRSLVSQYETLAADIVDRTSAYYGLSEVEMQEGLISLFSQYVKEWLSLQKLT